VWFTGEDAGVAVGGHGPLYGGLGGFIVRTTNGGATWTQETIDTDRTLYGVCFADANTGIAVGGVPTEGVMLRTTDAGATWVSQAAGSCVLDVCFADPLTGTAVGSSGLVLRTTDGGATWAGQPFYWTYALLAVWYAGFESRGHRGI